MPPCWVEAACNEALPLVDELSYFSSQRPIIDMNKTGQLNGLDLPLLMDLNNPRNYKKSSVIFAKRNPRYL
jgi:hypothetical protein